MKPQITIWTLFVCAATGFASAATNNISTGVLVLPKSQVIGKLDPSLHLDIGHTNLPVIALKSPSETKYSMQVVTPNSGTNYCLQVREPNEGTNYFIEVSP
jgi:hypothetical protein